MKVFVVAKWVVYLLASMSVGIALGLFSSTRSGHLEAAQAQASDTSMPIVQITEEDYHTEDGTVTRFSQWASGPIGVNFKRRYPPDRITGELQRRFFGQVVAAAERQGELESVIAGCALNAIGAANAEEAASARKAGVHRIQPATLLVYAQRAAYFGQDAWCFLCLSTADHHHGTLRAAVLSCVPSFGPVHVETVGTY